MKYKHNQHGFGLVETLLVIVIIGLLGGVGWYVYSNSQDKSLGEGQNSVSSGDNRQEEVEQLELSEDWKRYESGQKAFSIKLADGLSGTSDTQSDFMFFNTFDISNGPAELETTDGYGFDGIKVLRIKHDVKTRLDDLDDIKEKTEESFETSAGVQGTKITYTAPNEPGCDGLGCSIGEEVVIYNFTNPSSEKITRITYTRLIANEASKRLYAISESDPDYTKYVEEMAKTLEIN